MNTDPATDPKEPQLHNTAKGMWLSVGDGKNRATIRKEMAQAPRFFRATKREQMEHRQNVVAMGLHHLSGKDERTPEEHAKLRNEETLVGEIDGEVIDAAFDLAQRNFGFDGHQFGGAHVSNRQK